MVIEKAVTLRGSLLPGLLSRDGSKVTVPVPMAELPKLAPDQARSKVSRAACDLAAKPSTRHITEKMVKRRIVFSLPSDMWTDHEKKMTHTHGAISDKRV